MSAQRLILYEKPKLSKPYLIIGFEGWPDAGRVSSGVASYLRDKLAARKLADFAPDDFYLFQAPSAEAKRPVTDIQNGLIKEFSLPATTAWFHKSEGADHDLIILLGREPELRWSEYISLVFSLARSFGVTRIYALGGTYDVVPHTIEPLISAVISEPDLEPELNQYGIQLVNYRGPSSIHAMLLTSADRGDIEVINLWGYVPHYVQVANTRVCYTMLTKLTELLELDLDLDDILEDSRRLDEMVDKAVAQKPELMDYVKRLEEEYGKGEYEGGEPLKEDIIRDIENFLRKKDDA